MKSLKKCPVCKQEQSNLTMHIRKYAASEAFNKEFIEGTSTTHLDYLKKFKVISQDEPFILLKDGKLKIVDSFFTS